MSQPNQQPTLEVRIPIGLSESMFNRVHLITHSIRSLGGACANAKIRVSVGSVQHIEMMPEEVYRWSEPLDIEWSFVSTDLMKQWQHSANPNIPTMVYDRFFEPSTADFTLFLDVDVLAVKPFDNLMVPVVPAIQAMMAHASPFQNHEVEWFKNLEAIERATDFGHLHEHTGWGIMEFDHKRRYSPPYFNTGVVMMRKEGLSPLMCVSHQQQLDAARALYNSYFIDQIAFTRFILKEDLNYQVLPVKYNFPNDPGFDVRYPLDLADARFIHFLRHNQISRERDFESIDAIKHLIDRQDLKGSNEVLRKRVEEIFPLMEETLRLSGPPPLLHPTDARA